MKKSKKLLSILLAVVMVFSAVAVPASAAIPSNVTTLDALIQPANLSGVVEWLLTSLNNRKTYYADSVLNFVCVFVEDIKAEVPEGVDVFNGNVATSTKATYVMNFLDKMLAEQNLNEALGDDILNIINEIPGLKVNLNSVDGILATLESVEGIKGIAGGDIANLNLDALIEKSGLSTSAQSRSKTGDLQIIYNLIQFLADNINIFKKFFAGTLDLGIVGSVAGDLEQDIKGYAAEITVMVEDLVYESVLGAPDAAASHAESAYKDWTVDEMLVAALVKMITETIPEKEKMADVLNSSIADILAKYGDVVYDKYLLGWLNEDLEVMLEEFAAENELVGIFEDDINFDSLELDFTSSVNGLFGEFNNILLDVFDIIIADDVMNDLGFVRGDNSNIADNFSKLVKYVLPMLKDFDTGYDFSKYTEEYVADMTVDALAVDVLKMFFPGWFKLDEAETAVVAQADGLAELAGLAVYYAVIEFNASMLENSEYDYVSEWKELIFDADGNLLDQSNTAWSDAMATIGVDCAVYGLAYDSENNYFNFTLSDIAAKKAAGWGYIEFLDEVVDWALNMVKGLPAVADKLTFKRGVLDGYGPFYKVNVLLNEMIDLSFIAGCESGSFNFALEELLFECILNNFYEFDIEGVLSIFEDATTNVDGLFGKEVMPMLLDLVDNLLNILFAHSQPGTATATVAATCEEDGFSVKHCTKCGLYVEAPKAGAKATGHKKVAEVLTASSCEESGLVRYTCENCDYVSREVTDATGHIWGAGTVEIDGVWYIGEVCANCNESKGQLMPAPTPESIKVVSAPAKVEYELNSEEELDLTGLAVKVVYAGNVEEDVDVELITVETELDLTKEGEQVITISYLGNTATITVTVVDKSAPAYTLGDVDNNGQITTADARTALRAAVSLVTLEGNAVLAADYNCDGKITTADARSILRIAVGLTP